MAEGWELETEPSPSGEMACVAVVATASVEGVASPESPLLPQAAAKIAKDTKATDNRPGFFKLFQAKNVLAVIFAASYIRLGD